MSRSRIAIVSYHLAPGRVSKWLVGGYGVPENYVDAVRRAGGRPALLLPGDDASAKELLEPCDGLLLVGGGDVEPARYRGEPHPAIYGTEPDRDDLEIRLLTEAGRARVPTLAVCRGFQVMNVAFGGTLIGHLPDVPGSVEHGAPSGEDHVSHDVKVAPASRLAEATGAEVLSCSSHHHQGVDRLGEGLAATGWSEDGLVEAIERERGWMLGVQWHPEDTAADDPEQQALFDALVRRAREGR
jgi:putative glutamine amidotransferase